MSQPFSFLASEAGRVHVCGHRGYSLRYPENTLPALQAAKEAGASTVEIDVLLSAEGCPVLLHDLSVDRTTDGSGFAADLGLDRLLSLDAGVRFDARFAGTRIPTLKQALDWAAREEMGVVLEIKEAERPDLAVDRAVELIAVTGTGGQVVVLGFDHVMLKRAGERHPGLCTEAITHARHADLVGVLRACGARSVSIELEMFHPDDARALHDAGFSNRVHVPRPEVLAEFCRGGRDILPRVADWIAEGLIDTVSGDDVPFLASLVARSGRGGRR